MSTPVIIQGNSKRPLYIKVVRDGVPGNMDVIFQMIRLIRNSTKYDLGVNLLAADLLLNNHLDSYSPVETIFTTLFNFVKTNVKYIQDEAGRIESIKSPRRTLSDGYGDCDDQAILNATLLGSIGYEDVRITMARYDKTAENFQHVYAVVYQGGKRYVFDTTLPDAELDKEVAAYQIKEVSVYADTPGLDGFSGAYNNARYYARKAARSAVGMVPLASTFLPLGFIADQALTAGIGAIGNATAPDSLSLPATASSINEKLDDIINDLLKTRIAYDAAKSQALQFAAQLMAVEVEQDQKYALGVVKQSLKEKLAFIKNFPDYAHKNNIKLVYLHSGMMLATGVALAGGAGFTVYKYYQHRRANSER